VTSFEFYRFRFHFRGIDAVHFPPGKGGNAVRGALGLALRKAGDPSVYARLFEPAGKSPGGLADWPRPFVLRAAHLDGLTVPPGGRFHLDIHVFDVREPSLDIFRAAFAAMGSSGLGAGRGRAELERVEQLDLDDRAAIAADVPGTPSVVTLDACGTPVERVSVRFVTPTELKAGGELAARPEFPILFSRVRDRLSTLRALYGAGRWRSISARWASAPDWSACFDATSNGTEPSADRGARARFTRSAVSRARRSTKARWPNSCHGCARPVGWGWAGRPCGGRAK